VELPEKVDVVLSECLGNFAFSDAMFLTVGRFCERWLKPGGRRGPQRVRLVLQPADGRLFADPTTFFRDRYDDLDVSAFIYAAERRIEVCDALTPFLRAEPVVVADFDPLTRPETFELEADWELPEGKWVTGVLGWFDVDWSPESMMTTSPHAPGTHWSQTLFHVPFHLPSPGDRLRIRIVVTFSETETPRYRWSGAITSADGTVLADWDRDSGRLFTAD
jgi:protein arginine N-methyltransferase 1